MIKHKANLETSRSGLPSISGPATGPHRSFDSTPDLLDSLAVSPSLLGRLAVAVDVDTSTQDTSAPALDSVWQELITPANVDTESVAEEIGRMGPLVTLELPSLTGGEDGNNAVPVVGLEVIRRLDKDETERASWID